MPTRVHYPSGMTQTTSPAAGLAESTSAPDPIAQAVAAMGPGPLTEPGLIEHIHPLFSRVLKRDEIYLANHSLGRPLNKMADDITGAVDAWYADMDAAWGPWLAEQDRYRSNMARLIGLSDPKAVVPKTSAAQGLRAVLNAMPREGGPTRVIATRGEFDSIDIVLKVYASKGLIDMRWVEADAEGVFHASDIAAAIDGATDLVVFSQVIFATGQIVEHPETVIAKARACSAVTVLDTYHAAGVIPMAFEALGADFAIGGNYKYTRGGAGACWLAIHPSRLTAARAPGPDDLAPIDTGWFARPEPMGFGRTDDATLSAGGDGWLEATPPILTYFQANAGLKLTLALGVERLRAYNLEQQARLAETLRTKGVEAKAEQPRGAFMLLPHPNAQAWCGALKSRGVNTDARTCPTTNIGFVRVCPDILNTTDELDRAAAIIAETKP